MATTVSSTEGSKLFDDIASSAGRAAGEAAADKLAQMLRDPAFRGTLETEIVKKVVEVVDPWLLGSVFVAGASLGGMAMWFATRSRKR